MSERFDDDHLDARIRAVLDERAEEIAARAASPESMAWRMSAGTAPSPMARVRPTPGTRVGLSVAILVAALLVALLIALSVGTRPLPVPLRLAVDLSIGAEPGVETIVEAIRLGVRSAKRGDAYTVEVPDAAVYSDVVGGEADARLAATIAAKVVADPRNVALIGPYLSSMARVQIPATNAGGLLQCSPSNTDPTLTTGTSAAELRPRPDRPSYVRVATTDAVLVQRAAQFFLGDLGTPRTYVVTEGRPYPGDLAEMFTSAVKQRGGTVLGRAELPAADPDVSSLASEIGRANPDAIYFDGFGAGATRLLRALAKVGLGERPFVGLDPLLDGPRSVEGSFLALAGPLAAHAYAVFPATLDVTLEAQFKADYRAAHGSLPARYATTGLACTQVITAALERVKLPVTASPAEWREAVRAAVTGGATYPTVLGTIRFDAAGDVEPAGVSIYAYVGVSDDWAFREAIIAAPAP